MAGRVAVASLGGYSPAPSHTACPLRGRGRSAQGRPPTATPCDTPLGAVSARRALWPPEPVLSTAGNLRGISAIKSLDCATTPSSPARQRDWSLASPRNRTAGAYGVDVQPRHAAQRLSRQQRAPSTAAGQPRRRAPVDAAAAVPFGLAHPAQVTACGGTRRR